MNLLCWTMAPNPRVTRKWEIFAGRNKFFCDGHLMTAPHSGIFYLTVFLITGTSALFFAFDCPFLAEKITPAIPIIGGILYVFTMSSLFRTSFSDPGIIPRASQDEAAYIEKQIEVPNSLNSPTYRPPPRTKEVLVRGQIVKLKYCFTCKIFRPPRASHCSLCDNCVSRFDHHCPWVGNCVGKRNYRFFYMFIVSLAFLTVFIFTCSTTHIVLLTKDRNDLTLEAIKESPFSLIIAIICFLSVWSVIGLAGFHTYLITSDQTTNEDIKGSFSSKGGQHAVNPYSRGNICLNCFHILCGPIQPSLIDRRGIVTDEYRSQMLVPDPFMSNAPMIPQVPVTQSPENQGQKAGNIYDMDVEGNPSSTGVYRQRSYDNLHNGNSNSVDHLVENEIPLSTMQSPADEVHPNKVSGSYTNLFRASMDADAEVQQENGGVAVVENVYSNIPAADEDPTMHVYSNVGGEGNDLSFDVANNLLAASSTLLSDDLDLDDPAAAASAYRGDQSSTKSPTKAIAPKATGEEVTKVLKNGDVGQRQKGGGGGIEMKNVIPSVAESVLTGGSTTSRLKMLHDTTMIDTALDLDSLDGSSLGNNSSACLVKSAAAIV
ncbi:palmitoyltransferase ZDHHC9 [Lutzomyia longipalpis]|nr:palmitoyltransferase ZDHHC9 [Lutzomyia longipalpis]XP_055686844.1 palmitoyltransferase ZDHHC9 [Lutzomyia longipalpis]XP_055686846.1 palmitoyltransferase ZDHHC9 [Lutzomyia longipalpis]XP_055686847.1 palmitoyltransferase ZDHHC9 [Lutzomyia longipalpis]